METFWYLGFITICGALIFMAFVSLLYLSMLHNLLQEFIFKGAVEGYKRHPKHGTQLVHIFLLVMSKLDILVCTYLFE